VGPVAPVAPLDPVIPVAPVAPVAPAGPVMGETPESVNVVLKLSTASAGVSVTTMDPASTKTGSNGAVTF
jgi:hypothetical protein